MFNNDLVSVTPTFPSYRVPVPMRSDWVKLTVVAVVDWDTLTVIATSDWVTLLVVDCVNGSHFL
jgi:hypothetical protein